MKPTKPITEWTTTDVNNLSTSELDKMTAEEQALYSMRMFQLGTVDVSLHVVWADRQSAFKTYDPKTYSGEHVMKTSLETIPCYIPPDSNAKSEIEALIGTHKHLLFTEEDSTSDLALEFTYSQPDKNQPVVLLGITANSTEEKKEQVQCFVDKLHIITEEMKKQAQNSNVQMADMIATADARKAQAQQPKPTKASTSTATQQQQQPRADTLTLWGKIERAGSTLRKAFTSPSLSGSFQSGGNDIMEEKYRKPKPLPDYVEKNANGQTSQKTSPKKPDGNKAMGSFQAHDRMLPNYVERIDEDQDQKASEQKTSSPRKPGGSGNGSS